MKLLVFGGVDRRLARWLMRAVVLVLLVVAFGVFQQYKEGNEPCPPWEQLEPRPGGARCASYF